MLTQSANPLLLIPITESKREERIVTRNSADIAGLTRRLAAGDEQAFTEFHGHYFDRLYRFLIVLSRGHEQEAEEALQQTLLRVVRYARPFDSEEAFWCWLKAIARSTVRDAGRKQQRYSALLQRFAFFRRRPLSDESLSDPEENLRTGLEETLAELSPFDRELIEGKYLDGASTRDLALQTGLTEKAVESRLLRLRRQLRNDLLKNHISQ